MKWYKLFFVQMFWVNHDNLGGPPAQDDIFRIGDPELNLSVATVTGRGDNPHDNQPPFAWNKVILEGRIRKNPSGKVE